MNEKFYAEYDTDKIIRETYFPDYSYSGIVIEVGGGTPEFLSMSRHFKLNNWRAIIVEPNPLFVNLHKDIGNEVYQYACSNADKDDVDFTVVSINENKKENSSVVTDHSFSALEIKQSYVDIHKDFLNSLRKYTIKVNVRKMDTILDIINVDKIDILSVDVEGWELEVMEGLSKLKPKVVVLENVLHDESYNIFMENYGYKLDKKLEHNYIYLLNK